MFYTSFSRKFIYFNDDITLMKPTFLSDFWTAENGTKLFPKKDITPNWWTSRKECTPECKLVFQNRHCDSKCNTLRCEWDGGNYTIKNKFYEQNPVFRRL